MKRVSPEPHRDNISSKRRSTVPPSPPQSQNASPVMDKHERLAAVQKKIERAVNARFELEYKDDIVKYMKQLEVCRAACSRLDVHSADCLSRT